MTVRPAKTQICPGWPESLLSAWRKLGSLATHWAHSEDSDQTGRMPRLIWVFCWVHSHFVGVVMSQLISYFYFRHSSSLSPFIQHSSCSWRTAAIQRCLPTGSCHMQLFSSWCSPTFISNHIRKNQKRKHPKEWKVKAVITITRMVQSRMAPRKRRIRELFICTKRLDSRVLL